MDLSPRGPTAGGFIDSRNIQGVQPSGLRAISAFSKPPLGPGANALGEAIASETPSACFIQNGVYTKPGNTAVSKGRLQCAVRPL